MDKTATQWMVEPLKKYATFSGRARRKEFWWFYLLCVLAIVVLCIAFALLSAGDAMGVAALLLIPILALFVPLVAVQVRRLHDVNRSGWWLLGSVVLGALSGGIDATKLPQTEPLAVLLVALAQLGFGILILVWLCSRGTIGENRFGPDPLAAPDA
ncbi:DUF805 domain-containing protein [Polymorphobacter arshaanensis]|uniref:DUF805 domain-containing protein n=1 Tax=Glacieibacterium arshaanense TaxID=2511025 RepID=A0A4Y9EMF9_9SPHN|nr:DUF805 domain-containing protein [Polymorphobacter arshaanensis]TFU03207.1 DUF805 domain-containing protein [Polymorphobacter arshaanensis]